MIVVFGSINVDMVIQVPALPRPGETVVSGSYATFPGGKGGNTALAAARAGAATMLFGRVGEDGFAEDGLALLRADGVDLSGVLRSTRPTGCATVWVDGAGENAIVVAAGANLDSRAEQVPDSVLGPGTIVALQMEVPPAESWRLVGRAKRAGARVLLNLAPAGMVPETILRQLDVIVVNEVEAATLAADAGLNADTPSRVPGLLAERYDLTCIVTLGGAGAIAFGRNGGFAVPALPVTPVDTTAAGDAFCGGLAAALDKGLELDAALRHASTGAGLSCIVEGAQSSLPDAAAIEARLGELPPTRRLG